MVDDHDKNERAETGGPGFRIPSDLAGTAALLAEAGTLRRQLLGLPVLPDAAAAIERLAWRRGLRAAAALDGLSLEGGRESLGRSEPFAERVLETGLGRLARAWGRVLRRDRGLALSFEVLEDGWREIVGDALAPDPGPGAEAGLEESPGGHAPDSGRLAGGGRQARLGRSPRSRERVAALCAWLAGLKRSGREAPLLAVLAHYHLLRLEPFPGASPALARLAEILLLDAPSLRWAPLLLGERYLALPGGQAALAALASDETGAGLDAFVAVCLRAQIACLEEVRDLAASHLRELALDKYFDLLRADRKITPRQRALLRMLLAAGRARVTVRGLGRTPPFEALYGRASEQTARRDIARLAALGLLTPQNEGFALNRRALEAGRTSRERPMPQEAV